MDERKTNYEHKSALQFRLMRTKAKKKTRTTTRGVWWQTLT